MLHPSHMNPRSKKPFLGCSFDPTIPVAMDRAMDLITVAVSKGWHWYVAGEIEASKALALAQRFNERYGLDADRFQRSRARSKGAATFQLFFWPLAGKTTLAWYLLRSEGEHPLLSLETWRDAQEASSRIQWPFWYELVRTPVPMAHRKKLSGPHSKAVKSVTWTWRLVDEVKDSLRADIRRNAQSSKGLVAIVESLKRTNGSRGARDDVKQLYQYIRRQEFKYSVPESERVAIPKTIRWISKRACRRVPLSVLAHRAQSGNPVWFPSSS